MTKKEFEKYGFTAKTIIYFDDDWHFIDSVDFKDGTILPKEFGVWVHYSEIEDIQGKAKL